MKSIIFLITTLCAFNLFATDITCQTQDSTLKLAGGELEFGGLTATLSNEVLIDLDAPHINIILDNDNGDRLYINGAVNKGDLQRFTATIFMVVQNRLRIVEEGSCFIH